MSLISVTRDVYESAIIYRTNWSVMTSFWVS